MPMTVTQPLPNLLARSAALACFAAASCLVLQAQQTAAPSHPTLNLVASIEAPVDLSDPGASYSSSGDSVTAERVNLAGEDSSQPPPRRRYSRPRYSDRMHNADGSNKITVAFGGGMAAPVGNSSNIYTPSYALEAAVGYNFNKKLGLLAEIGYDHFGLQGSVINAQYNYYNSLGIVDPTTGQAANFSGLDANAHVWSVALDPIYTFFQGDTFGAYVIGGGGYYHKSINFTTPQTSYFSPYGYGYGYPITQNANFDTHSANGGGFNAGAGITFKPSRFGAVKLYLEARYVYDGAKLYPEKGNPSPVSTLDSGSDSYMPITFGLRW